jgi:hypothetical protein
MFLGHFATALAIGRAKVAIPISRSVQSWGLISTAQTLINATL